MGIVDSLTAEPEIIEAEKKACNCNCHGHTETKSDETKSDEIKSDFVKNDEKTPEPPEENREEEDAEEEEEDDTEEDTEEESGGDTEEEEENQTVYSPIPDSQIYVVCINNVPYFYAKTLTDAQEKARNTLLNMRDDCDRTYHIDEEDSYTMNLTSTYRWFVVNYDTLEATCKIHYVNQITE